MQPVSLLAAPVREILIDQVTNAIPSRNDGFSTYITSGPSVNWRGGEAAPYRQHGDQSASGICSSHFYAFMMYTTAYRTATRWP